MPLLETAPQRLPHAAGVEDRAPPAGHWPLVVVLVLGALVRLLLISGFHGQPIYIADARDYDAIAVNLVQRGEFADVPGRLTSIRPPLYPAVVAGIYWITGSQNHTAVRLAQMVIGLMTTLVVYQLAKSMYSRRIALWAAAGVCFYPALVFQSNLLLTETLFTFLLCLFCLLIERSLITAHVGWLFAAGVVLGLAALTRSVLWLFPPFLVLFLFWALKRVQALHSRTPPAESDLQADAAAEPPLAFLHRAALALVPALAFCLVLAPWTVRNTLLHETFTTVDVMGGRNFMMGNYEYTSVFRSWATIDEARGERAWYRVLRAEHPEFPRLTQGQKDKLAMKRGLRFALAHPLLTAQRDVIKFLNFWQLDRAVVAGFAQGFWGPQAKPVVLGIGALMAGSYALVMVLAVFGFVMTRPAEVRLHWFLFLLLAFICGIHSAVFGHERYRLPLMPLAIVYASAAAVKWREIWQERTRWPFWLAAALCLILAVGWLCEVVVVEFDQIRSHLF